MRLLPVPAARTGPSGGRRGVVSYGKGANGRDLVPFHILQVSGGQLTARQIGGALHTSTAAPAARKHVIKSHRDAPGAGMLHFATAMRVAYQGKHIEAADGRVGWQIKLWSGSYFVDPAKARSRRVRTKSGSIKIVRYSGGSAKTKLMGTYSVPFHDLPRAVRAVNYMRRFSGDDYARAVLRRAFRSEKSYAAICAKIPEVCPKTRAGGGRAAAFADEPDFEDYAPRRRGGAAHAGEDAAYSTDGGFARDAGCGEDYGDEHYDDDDDDDM